MIPSRSPQTNRQKNTGGNPYGERQYTPLFHDLPKDLNLSDRAVYGQIKMRMNFKKGKSTASVDTIAEALGISESTVKRSISVLLQRDLIEQLYSGKASRTPSHYIARDVQSSDMVQNEPNMGQNEPRRGSKRTMPRVKMSPNIGQNEPQEEEREDSLEEYIEDSGEAKGSAFRGTAQASPSPDAHTSSSQSPDAHPTPQFRRPPSPPKAITGAAHRPSVPPMPKSPPVPFIPMGLVNSEKEPTYAEYVRQGGKQWDWPIVLASWRRRHLGVDEPIKMPKFTPDQPFPPEIDQFSHLKKSKQIVAVQEATAQWLENRDWRNQRYHSWRTYKQQPQDTP